MAQRPPRRFSASTVAYAAIVVVVLAIVAVVLVAVTGKSTPTSNKGSGSETVTAAQASVLDAIAAVTPAEAAKVGLPSAVSAPMIDKGQPALTSGTKPETLAILAEFCPYCAAERWALIMTFQRFGTFTNLHETTSSLYDVYPGTATFTFYQSSYSSPYVDFDPVEFDGNDTDAVDTHTVLEPLTSAQSDLWSKYETHFGGSEGFPFLDIDNKVFVVSPSYDPQLLAGQDQSAIAATLSNPDSSVAKAIIGTANYLTAAVCAVDGGQPSTWCSASAIKSAASAMGLS